MDLQQYGKQTLDKIKTAMTKLSAWIAQVLLFTKLIAALLHEIWGGEYRKHKNQGFLQGCQEAWNSGKSHKNSKSFMDFLTGKVAQENLNIKQNNTTL
jgi:hypothetical protein